MDNSHLVAVFVPIMRKFPEMLYQQEQDYIFDCSKFEKCFGMMATSNQDGIQSLIESLTN
jgi:hypothetical protein